MGKYEHWNWRDGYLTHEIATILRYQRMGLGFYAGDSPCVLYLDR